MSHHRYNNMIKRHLSLFFLAMSLVAPIGVKYAFLPASCIRPFIMGGLHMAWNMGMKETDVTFRHSDDLTAKEVTGNLLFNNETRLGVYLGAGVDLGHVRISAVWKKAGSNSSGVNEKGCVMLTAAYLIN